ncbi:sulfurtransferase complex subunit TusD [Shewanella fodinae]|jgi:tRNA 2-thiouridine synthesizing protein D|uniref:tRNA 2-thiouridine synthesizing protein D n=1 Tax=Shewanella fodinae TaxID=552357 RepID=A0A4R2F7Y6_9GAMM|nr:sulfurtransferase complex subunit TusD [Shewanella fodinae]MDN5370753.1 tRNA 2-thiouridine synthesizing protein [Shewanella sp.]TCN83301.1 tRNA 2-thiouridine synthesizing protein D [Shewanella fodinae]
MSKLIILVTGQVYGPASGWRVLQFTQAALAAGEQIHCVFFFRNGVTQSNALVCPASDETNLLQEWQKIAEQYHVPLINCVSAAWRRGIMSADDAKENGRTSHNLAEPFIMGGLGELVTGIEQADRVVSF